MDLPSPPRPPARRYEPLGSRARPVADRTQAIVELSSGMLKITLPIWSPFCRHLNASSASSASYVKRGRIGVTWPCLYSSKHFSKTLSEISAFDNNVMRFFDSGWLTLPSARAFLAQDAQCPRNNKNDLPQRCPSRACRNPQCPVSQVPQG